MKISLTNKMSQMELLPLSRISGAFLFNALPRPSRLKSSRFETLMTLVQVKEITQRTTVSKHQND